MTLLLGGAELAFQRNTCIETKKNDTLKQESAEKMCHLLRTYKLTHTPSKHAQTCTETIMSWAVHISFQGLV